HTCRGVGRGRHVMGHAHHHPASAGRTAKDEPSRTGQSALRRSATSRPGAEANTFSPRARESLPTVSRPRTELPAPSSGGENVPTAPLPGAIATMPPETPDLAGSPISESHCPERPYMPHAVATATPSRTDSRGPTHSTVQGSTPPAAR